MEIQDISPTRIDLRDRPVFICGHPKSGTTLLRSLLDHHPQLLVYPDETFFFRGFLPEIKTLPPADKISLAQRYLMHYFQPTENNHIKVSQGISNEEFTYQQYAKTCKVMLDDLQQNAVRHDGDLLAAVMLAFGRVNGHMLEEKVAWVEKTPYNEHFTDQIFSWWPQARCIHVLRDPRDNYATYHRKHPGLVDVEFGWSWNASLAAGVRNQNRYGLDRYLMLRYEDLLQESEQVLNKVINFLDIKDDESLRKPTRNGKLWEGNSMYNERFAGISASPIGRWKTSLTDQELKLVELICGSGMRRMDYPKSSSFSIKTIWLIFAWFVRQMRKLQGELQLSFQRVFGRFPQ